MSEPKNAAVVSRWQYIGPILLLILAAMVLVYLLIILRPDVPPLDIISNVLTGLAPTIAALLAYLKSQETHLSVNSRLDAFISQHEKIAFDAGVAQALGKEEVEDVNLSIETPAPAVVKPVKSKK